MPRGCGAHSLAEVLAVSFQCARLREREMNSKSIKLIISTIYSINYGNQLIPLSLYEIHSFHGLSMPYATYTSYRRASRPS